MCRIKTKTLTETRVLALNQSLSEFQAELGGLVFGRLLLVRPTFLFLLLILPVLMRGDAALMCLLIRHAETL